MPRDLHQEVDDMVDRMRRGVVIRADIIELLNELSIRLTELEPSQFVPDTLEEARGDA